VLSGDIIEAVDGKACAGLDLKGITRLLQVLDLLALLVQSANTDAEGAVAGRRRLQSSISLGAQRQQATCGGHQNEMLLVATHTHTPQESVTLQHVFEM
jgi:hypothetical protein